MDEIFRDTSSQSRSACTECQRRKQKCNREWPCNHCQKRKVADQCRFNQGHIASAKAPQEAIGKKLQSSSDAVADSDSAPSIGAIATADQPQPQPQPLPQLTGKKRQISTRDDYAEDDHSDDGDDDDGLGLEDLGYMATHQFANLGLDVKKERPAPRQYWAKASACSPLERALKVLPRRSHMDALVQNFFNNVNYHYYIIYPPVFLKEYQDWWEKRSQNRPLSLQWTCLLLMVCACASQHLPVDMQEKLEAEMGETAQKLTERYHDTARELASVVPVGYYHMYNVQWLLHSCYWFKAEARFLECWHVLGAAAREAQELGFHRKEAAEHLPEFDREMRRRVWCVVDTWDWQISSGLFRPTIIDRTDCNVDLPTLTLEDYTPSPLMHMKLQSELIRRLAARFTAPKNIATPSQVQEYKTIIEEWMLTFPPAYALKNPDTSGDKLRPWITFHRHYIHTMGFMMLLNPIRSFMSMTFTKETPAKLLAIRAIGVDYSLRQMDVLRDWVEFVSYRDGRFHFIIFSLFDTAAVLSTALIKDEDHTIPSRNEIYVTIDTAVAMLKRLMALSPTAKMSYDILSRIVRKVPRPSGYSQDVSRKRQKAALPPVEEAPVPAPTQASQTSVPPPAVYAPVQAPVQTQMQAPAQMPAVGVAAAATTAAAPMPHIAPTPTPSDEHLYAHHEFVYESPAAGEYGYGDNMTSVSTPQSDFTGVHGFSYSTTSESTPASVDGSAGSPNSSVNSSTGMFHDLPPVDESVSDHGFETITDAELGELATLWNWQSLNLDFISSEAAAVAAQQSQP